MTEKPPPFLLDCAEKLQATRSDVSVRFSPCHKFSDENIASFFLEVVPKEMSQEYYEFVAQRREWVKCAPMFNVNPWILEEAYPVLFEVNPNGEICYFNRELRATGKRDTILQLETIEEFLEFVTFSLSPKCKNPMTASSFQEYSLSRLLTGPFLVVWLDGNPHLLDLTKTERLKSLPRQFLSQVNLYVSHFLCDTIFRETTGLWKHLWHLDRGDEVSYQGSDALLQIIARLRCVACDAPNEATKFGKILATRIKTFGTPKLLDIFIQQKDSILTEYLDQGEDLNLPSWISFCESNRDLLRELKSSYIQLPGFFWCSDRCGLCYRNQMPESGSEGLDLPMAYFKVDPNRNSVFFINDILDHTTDVQKAISILMIECDSLEEIVEKFGAIRIVIPKSKELQVQFGIELRAMREALLEGVTEMSQEKETTDRILDLTWHKLRQVGILRSVHIQEVSALLNPLPYFIERPYRSFLRADLVDDKADAGIDLIGFIVKSMAFLAIEEWMHNRHDSDTPIPSWLENKMRNIGEGPLSDGVWVEIFRGLWKECLDQIPLMQMIGQPYRDRLDVVDEAVSVRNSCYGHRSAPNKKERLRLRRKLNDFLVNEFQQVVESLREGFSQKMVLAPLSQSFDNERGQVIKAKSIMGFDSEFKTVEIIPVEGIVNYLDGEPILYAQDSFFPSRQYFRCEKESGVITGVSIFDKTSNSGERQFTRIY